MDVIIAEYKAKMPGLRHVHLWSDGCGGQFKNKNELFWVSNGLHRYGVRIVHHFFQSCHGKGPSDSEGAVVKSGLHRAEFQNYQYVSTFFLNLFVIYLVPPPPYFLSLPNSAPRHGSRFRVAIEAPHHA